MKSVLAERRQRSHLCLLELRQAYATPIHTQPTQAELELHLPLLRDPTPHKLNRPEQGDVAIAIVDTGWGTGMARS